MVLAQCYNFVRLGPLEKKGPSHESERHKATRTPGY